MNWGRTITRGLVMTCMGLLMPVACQNRRDKLTTRFSPAAVAPAATRPTAFIDTIPETALFLEMVPIPAGRFRMGSPEDEPKRNKKEGPQFEVQVEPFYMSKYEVTWDLYNQFLLQYSELAMKHRENQPFKVGADVVTYPTPIYDIEAGPALQRMGGREGKFPAVIISRFAARQFTKWLSRKTGRFYRLPSEAEWEYACRAGSTSAYSFGDDPKLLPKYGWFVDNSELKDGDPGYRLVGQKLPNAWGLHDMHGNVGEWVIDQYAADDYAKIRRDHPVPASETIRWPTQRYPGVIRGGGFESEASECRSASRRIGTIALNQVDPDLPKSAHWEASAFDVGFRVVSPLRTPPEAEQARWWDADDPITIQTLKRDREIHEQLERHNKPVND